MPINRLATHVGTEFGTDFHQGRARRHGSLQQDIRRPLCIALDNLVIKWSLQREFGIGKQWKRQQHRGNTAHSNAWFIDHFFEPIERSPALWIFRSFLENHSYKQFGVAGISPATPKFVNC
jgi:hypothetical protein